MGKLLLRFATAVLGVGLLSACGSSYGTPEREESFSVQSGQCDARWWLEPLVDEVPKEASNIALQSLQESDVSSAELQEWKKILSESDSSEDRQIPAYRLEGYAYVEAVRADVRAGLAAAGYPDTPTRLIEVYSDSDCSPTS